MARQVKMKTNINPLLLAIPATCDVCGTTLMFVALIMVPASVYQMMRGLIVPITALFSVVFLKRKQYRHHITGIVLIISGVFFVGYVSVAGSKSDSSDGGSELFGIFLLIVSQCFTGTMFIVEEKLLSDYYLEPFQIVGTEGMWGLVCYIMLLPIMQLVQCGSQTDPKGFGLLCNYGYLENSSFAFYQLGLNHMIIWLFVMTVASISLFNSFGIATTKYASAAQRSTIDTSRTLTIWILSCLLGLEKFMPWEIPGFVLLVTGTLLYNEIIVFPYLGFNLYTKEALAKAAGSDKRQSNRQE